MNTHENYPFPQKNETLFRNKGSDIFAAWVKERQRKIPYIEGYKYTADLIWRQIEQSQNKLITEELIHPFITMQRRSIEVMLRYLISLGSKILNKNFPDTETDLIQLWNKAKPMIVEIGGSAQGDITAMEYLLFQLHSTDGAPFAFEYRTDSKGEKYVTGIDWDSLITFRQISEKMRKYLQAGCMHFKTIIEPEGVQ